MTEALSWIKGVGILLVLIAVPGVVGAVWTGWPSAIIVSLRIGLMILWPLILFGLLRAAYLASRALLAKRRDGI